MTRDQPTWSTGHVTVTDPTPVGMYAARGALSDPFRVLHIRTARPRGDVLHLEAARSLREWLDWWIHDFTGTPPAAEWDRLRGPIADGRLAIRERTQHPECSEDERAGLAYAENVLRRLDDAEREARRDAELAGRAGR